MKNRTRSFAVFVAAALAAAFAPVALALGVQPRFELSDPQAGPFPADLFTVLGRARTRKVRPRSQLR